MMARAALAADQFSADQLDRVREKLRLDELAVRDLRGLARHA